MVIKLGFFANHETCDPISLLHHAVLAELAGFDTVWNSDHFHPWVHTEGQCGFSWVWMASTLERVPRVQVGTGVTAPILRYNPAIVAQAFATLGFMYPDRVFLGVGAGEALNEVPCGCIWPSPRERVERLEEAIIVIKKLWTGTIVSFKGRYYRLNKANLYTKPSKPVPIYLASFGVKVAQVAGRHADGYLYLVGRDGAQYFTQVVWPAVEKGAKEAGRDPAVIEKITGFGSSYSEDYDKALRSALVWRAPLLPTLYKYEIYDTREVEELGRYVGREELAQRRLIATSPEDYIKRFEEMIRLGFHHIYVSSSSPDQEKFFRIMREKVLPYLKETYREK